MQHLVSSLSVSGRPVHRLRENCRSMLKCLVFLLIIIIIIIISSSSSSSSSSSIIIIIISSSSSSIINLFLPISY